MVLGALVAVVTLLLIVIKFAPFVAMASKVVDQGLQQSADNDAGNGAALAVQSMSISNFGTLLAGTTTLAAATQKASSTLDSHARSGNVLSYIATFGTSTGTIAVSNIVVHRVASGTYTNVYGGVDALSITKDNTYTLVPTLQVTYSST